jgi:hypothetical protein
VSVLLSLRDIQIQNVPTAVPFPIYIIEVSVLAETSAVVTEVCLDFA